MKEILRTQTLSQAHGLRTALAAEGIEAVVQGEHSLGTIAGGVSVWVVHDTDFDRARAVLGKLSET